MVGQLLLGVWVRNHKRSLYSCAFSRLKGESVPVQSIMLHGENMSYPVLGYDRGLVGLLGKEDMSKRLDDLLKKREQLNAQIQKEKNKQNQQKRKEDTRRKILMGALMMDMMKKGELDEKKIRKRLDGFLTKEMDRKLFDLKK